MKILNIAALFVLLTSNVPTFAAGVANSFFVISVRADASGNGYVRFDKPLVAEGSLPECSTHANHLAFNVNTLQGKAIMSLVLAAQASNSPVYAKGTGDCTVYSVVESWEWGRIE
jgi:hypothetical protein